MHRINLFVRKLSLKEFVDGGVLEWTLPRTH